MRSIFRLMVLAAVAVPLVLGMTGGAWAEIDVAGWQFEELSGHDIPVGSWVSLDDGRAAWLRRGSDRADIFLLDTATGVERQITDTPESEYGIALDGDRLVWAVSLSSEPLNSAGLFLHDLETGETRLVAEGRISQSDPVQCVGDHIAFVWYEPVGGDSTGGAGWERHLCVLTISTGVLAEIGDRVASVGMGSSGATSFDLGEDYLGFVEVDASGTVGQVRLLDLSDGRITDIGQSLGTSLHVSLAGDLVTWAAPAGSLSPESYEPASIWLKKISGGPAEEIGVANTPEPFPKTDGRFVVWDHYPEDSVFSRRVIVGYDSQSEALLDVSTNLFLNFTPELSDGLVVWERGGELDSEIMARDLVNGQTTQLSNNRTWMDQLALVAGRTVVWWKHWFGMETGVVEPADRVMLATAPGSSPDRYSDVGGDQRYRTAVLGVSEAGIVDGYAESGSEGQEFRPEASLLRAQFAKMVCEALDVPVSPGLVSPFIDLGIDDPSALYPHQYVAALSAAGIVNGTTANTFFPYASLTRAQAVSILVRALDALRPGSIDGREEQPPGAYHWNAPHSSNLKRAYASDLMSSMVDWRQRWDAGVPCSRGEAAQLVWNALSLLDERDEKTPAGSPWERVGF